MAYDLFGEGFIQLLHVLHESLLQSFVGFAVSVGLVNVTVQEKGKVLVVEQDEKVSFDLLLVLLFGGAAELVLETFNLRVQFLDFLL